MLRDPVRPVLVAADEKDALCAYAFCVLQVHEGDGAMNDGKTLYLDDLCVDEARRGEHIGKTLYLATVDYARRLGCHNLTLNAWSCNENAVRFYRAWECRCRSTAWRSCCSTPEESYNMRRAII